MVRLIIRKEALTGRGTFGLVRRVKLLKVIDVTDADSIKSKTCVFFPRFCTVIKINIKNILSAEGQTGESLAMKTISVRRKESRELMILQKLNHENIIKLRNFYI